MYGTIKPKELLEHVEHFEFCKLMDPFETMYVEVTARDREGGWTKISTGNPLTKNRCHPTSTPEVIFTKHFNITIKIGFYQTVDKTPSF